MSHTTKEARNTDVAGALRASIGPEADYYLEHLHKLEPERFAVIKVGGDTVQQDLEFLASDIAMLSSLGLYPVIVHGGKPQINTLLKEQGVEEKRHNGLRVTDETTLECVQQGLDQVNQELVTALESKGTKAVGLTEGVFIADYSDESTLGFVGAVAAVDVTHIKSALLAGVVPVVSCLGQAGDGQLLNINGDPAAQALSTSLKPSKFIMLTNVPGVLDRDGQLISVINDSQEVDRLILDGTVSEGMIPKVQSGLKALSTLPNDSSVVITSPQQLIRELFTHQGGGTLLRRGDAITMLPSVNAIDQAEGRKLIESTFGKQLADDYFAQLPNNAEVFITDRGYRGMAIVLPQEDGPAYIDKLVVDPTEQGHGIGDEIVDVVLKHHPWGVFWRVRKDNASIDWYRARGRGQEFDWQDDEWSVFFTKEVKPDVRAQYAAWAVVKEQTMLPRNS